MNKQTRKAKPVAKKASPKTKKKKRKITNLIIIDASGSMNSKKEEVIGGLKQIFKQIREDLKKDKKDVTVRNIVLDFASAGDIQILIDSEDVGDLRDSVAEMYETRGVTALLDAIGKGFSMLDNDSDGVFINILTDGMENDSKEHKPEDVKRLIDGAKSKNWAVTFMGTTEASVLQARSLGISMTNTVVFADTREGVAKSMKLSNMARSMYYSAALSDNLNAEEVSTLMRSAEKKTK